MQDRVEPVAAQLGIGAHRLRVHAHPHPPSRLRADSRGQPGQEGRIEEELGLALGPLGGAAVQFVRRGLR
jgi:hypothetical protein